MVSGFRRNDGGGVFRGPIVLAARGGLRGGRRNPRGVGWRGGGMEVGGLYVVSGFRRNDGIGGPGRWGGCMTPWGALSPGRRLLGWKRCLELAMRGTWLGLRGNDGGVGIGMGVWSVEDGIVGGQAVGWRWGDVVSGFRRNDGVGGEFGRGWGWPSVAGGFRLSGVWSVGIGWRAEDRRLR